MGQCRFSDVDGMVMNSTPNKIKRLELPAKIMRRIPQDCEAHLGSTSR